MALTIRSKILISLGAVVAVAAIVTPSVVVPLVRNNNGDYSSIEFTLLYNAGVMIEVNDIRIYVDPYTLSFQYEDYPADIILITHHHGDHYDTASIDIIRTDDTTIVFPEIMSTAINSYGGIGVVPEDELEFGDITITAFYMYTLPVGDFPASHPEEDQYCSYIIDIDGFTFFHAGDSKNIAEYSQITGTIDVALMPLGPGCQTMCDMEVVSACNTIRPDYLIPIHYGEGVPELWGASYSSYLTTAQYLNLDYYESATFENI